jgi:hypothetical protein
VTYQPFETYVDFAGHVTWMRNTIEGYAGRFEFSVVQSSFVPDNLDSAGGYVARPDGRLELRDVWLGPGAAECGHVLERWALNP